MISVICQCVNVAADRCTSFYTLKLKHSMKEQQEELIFEEMRGFKEHCVYFLCVLNPCEWFNMFLDE